MACKHVFSTTRCMTRRCILAGLTSLLALGSGAVLAQNATIEVVGEIVKSTCSLSIRSTTLNIGTVQRSVFKGIGTASDPSVPDYLALAPGCSGIKMTFDAKADPNRRSLFAINLGGATGVGIKLEGDGSRGWTQVMPIGSPGSVPIEFFGNAFRFRASYEQSADIITSGTANATIAVLVTYN